MQWTIDNSGSIAFILVSIAALLGLSRVSKPPGPDDHRPPQS